MLPASSPVGEMNWGEVFLRLEVPGLSFIRACTNTCELSGDRGSVQIHESGEATNMKGVSGPGKSLVQNYNLSRPYAFTLCKV